jgi:hypothetical protein
MTNTSFPWLDDTSMTDLDRCAGALVSVLDLIYTQLAIEFKNDPDSEAIPALNETRDHVEMMIQYVVNKQNAIRFAAQ